MAAFADQTGFVISLYFKGDDPAFHRGDFRFRPDLQTHRSGSHMANIQLRTYGGLAISQSFSDGLAGCAFHQCHHAGGGVNQQATGANLGGGVLPFNAAFCQAFHSNSDFQNNHAPFYSEYTLFPPKSQYNLF